MTDRTPPPTSDTMPDWERRVRARRLGLPDWALDAPERCAVVATTDAGALEIHSWTRGGDLVQLTQRPDGTTHTAIDPSGEHVWWFDDELGDEYGVWRRQPFGSAPGEGVEDATGLPPAYSAGLALGRGGLAVVASSDDEYGAKVHVVAPGTEPREIYSHRESAYLGDLTRDGTLVALSHSEHGDSRHPAVTVLRVADGAHVGELWDGPGKGLDPQQFCPLPGDPRLLVIHEREGSPRLLVWDPVTGAEQRLDLDVPGEVADAQWFPDAASVLVGVDHDARTRLYRVTLDPVTTTPVGPQDGTVTSATVRPDGSVWLSWSSAAQPPAVRDAAGGVVLTPLGDPAPPSVPVEDVWVDGPGGRIHALLRRPAGPAPYPTLVEAHGGPTHHDTDSFGAWASAWVDHGYAVVQVNYRGSTGYGSAWRDALDARIGHVELEDVRAVRDHLVAAGVADPQRTVLAGASWGGFLTLLGLGTQPDAWALGSAGVPVADYVAAYEDEMEGLKAFDRALFGGSPEQVPDKYADSSPITYVDQVRVPVLVLAGENDPRCPIRQIENYVGRLAERGVPHEVYRYDAGHGSPVDDERVRQLRVELDFAARHLGTTPPL